MSGLNYGSETWVLPDKQSKTAVHVGMIRLYRRLLHVAHDQHLSDEEILTRCMTPSPTEVLRRAQTSLFGHFISWSEFDGLGHHQLRHDMVDFGRR